MSFRTTATRAAFVLFALVRRCASAGTGADFDATDCAAGH